MKNHILLLLLTLSFLYSNGQNQNNNDEEHYILTTKGKKIKIAPNRDITFSRFTINYYKKSWSLR